MRLGASDLAAGGSFDITDPSERATPETVPENATFERTSKGESRSSKELVSGLTTMTTKHRSRLPTVAVPSSQRLVLVSRVGRF